MQNRPQEHWNDEQLIAYLYGIGPENAHLDACSQCRSRLSLLESNRQALDDAGGIETVNVEFLSAQRRAIYEKLDTPVRWWAALNWKRWAPVAATLLILGGGAAMYQGHWQKTDENVSDVQLAQEVSRMSQEFEAAPTAPLHGLFE